MKYHSPSNGPTALFRAQEDGYLDLRLEQDVSPNILRFLSELTSPADCSQQNGEGLPELEPIAERMGNALKPAVYKLKSTLLECLDLRFAYRRCRYLVQIVRSLYPPLPPEADGEEGKDGERGRLLAVIMKLNSLKEFLYEQEERVLRYERSQQAMVKAFSAEVESRLQGLCEQVRSLRISIPDKTGDLLKKLNNQFNADPGTRKEWIEFWSTVNNCEADVQKMDQALSRLMSKTAPGGSPSGDEVEDELHLLLDKIAKAQKLAGETLKGIEGNQEMKGRIDFCRDLYELIHQKITCDTDELNRLIHQGNTPEGELRDIEARIHFGAWKLRDALDSFYFRDMIIYPLMQAEEVGGELQPVNFARISPGDANRLLPGLTAREKVAGEKFAHFGGFFSRKWRGNDLTWGRLDTAEIIISRLLPGPEHEAERKALIQQAHEEILAEMSNLGVGIYNRTDGRPPERKDLIGTEDISVIPARSKLDWVTRGLLTLLKMVRKSWADTKAAAWLPKVTGVFDWVIGLLSAVVFAISRSRALRYVLVAIIVILAGIVWWNYSLEELWTVWTYGS